VPVIPIQILHLCSYLDELIRAKQEEVEMEEISGVNKAALNGANGHTSADSNKLKKNTLR